MPPPKDPIKFEEWRKKLSVANTGKKFTKKHCSGISKAAKIRMQSPEARKKLSIANMGKITPPEQILKQINSRKTNNLLILKGELQRKQYKMSVETRKKMSAAKTGSKHPLFGKPRPEETRKKMSATNKIVMASLGVRLRISNTLKRENCYKWAGGGTNKKYCIKFNAKRKRLVSEFFGDCCICCGIHFIENIDRQGVHKKLSIHHIYHDKDEGCNGRPFNLVPLCMKCHGKEKNHEKEYKKYINRTLQNGFVWGIWSKKEYEEQIMYSD